jgi:hypothetical protein
MKVKVQFIAEEEIEGKEPVKVKDALQIIGLAGNKLAVHNFGREVANNLAGSLIPPDVTSDIMGFRKLCDVLYSNEGDEIEFDEKFIPCIKEIVKKIFPAITFIALSEMLDEAVLMAKNDSEAKKVEKKPTEQKLVEKKLVKEKVISKK